MQSPAVIPGQPCVAILCTSGDEEAAALARRIESGLRRQGVTLAPLTADGEEIPSSVRANCAIVLGEAASMTGPPAAPGNGARLLALFGGSSAPSRLKVLLPDGPAAMAVVCKPEMTEREAALFLVELFSELHTHCKQAINAGMLRFCFAKAARLAPGKAEVWT